VIFCSPPTARDPDVSIAGAGPVGVGEKDLVGFTSLKAEEVEEEEETAGPLAGMLDCARVSWKVGAEVEDMVGPLLGMEEVLDDKAGPLAGRVDCARVF